MYRDNKGNVWLKGNLHMHTVLSDGTKSPEDAAGLYKENGYDFISITDHWKISEHAEISGLLNISGVEYNFGKDVREGIYHILGLNMKGDPKVLREDSAQIAIDKIHSSGGMAVLAHPAWSINTPEQIISLHGIDATEIFNSESDLPRNCRPYSGAVLDMLASRGIAFPMLAVDDVHWYQNNACRSFIRVKCDELSADSVIAAIIRQDFYATQGPHLEVERTENGVKIITSPCEKVVFYTDSVWSKTRTVIGENITEATYDFAPNDTYVRVEITDERGKTAWSNVIFR